ncbi:MAG TPA: hypothetical protein VMS76_14580 [Planctomycetota bacterium]|nr:hypothetical protein [Planctomycetota bacterium]
MNLANVLGKIRAFEREAHGILAMHEAAPSRLVLLEDTYKKLAVLSLRQDDLLRQSLRCIENELYRAAHVMAWAAFMDFLEEKLASDGLVKLRAIRPAWKASSVEDLRDNVVEFQLLESARELGLCGKTETKALQGLLSKRNECAHPSNYFPSMNETLGYVTEILNRIGILHPKVL